MGASVWLLVFAVIYVEWAAASSAVPGVVNFSVIAPSVGTSNYEPLGAILSSVDLAVQAISQPTGPLPGWKIPINNRDGNCSSTHGPLAAFEIHKESGK